MDRGPRQPRETLRIPRDWTGALSGQWQWRGEGAVFLLWARAFRAPESVSKVTRALLSDGEVHHLTVAARWKGNRRQWQASASH